MGHMKRAEAREAAERERLADTIAVDMNFFARRARHRNGTFCDEWIVQIEQQVNGRWQVLGRSRTYGSEDKLRELVRRTPTRMILEDRQAFDYALLQGRGRISLRLTRDQYEIWRSGRIPPRRADPNGI